MKHLDQNIEGRPDPGGVRTSDKEPEPEPPSLYLTETREQKNVSIYDL